MTVMHAKAGGSPPGAVSPPKARSFRAKRPGMAKFAGSSETKEARQVATAILEVLAGARSPSEAADALGVSLPRYYALEGRALEGLLKACEPRAKGPRRSPEREIARLEKELDRLEREGARTQALLRAAQRTVGLPALDRKSSRSSPEDKKPHKRRPVARALRAARILRSQDAGNSVETKSQGGENVSEGAK